MPDIAVAAVDTDDNLVMFSPGFKHILGDINPVNLTDLTQFVPLFDDAEGQPLSISERPLSRATRGETVRDLIAAVRHTDGTWRYLRFIATPLRGPDETVIGAIALVQDVTAAHRLRRYQGELRDRLITTINHQFRSPLSLVLGHAELLEDFRQGLPTEIQLSIDALARGAKQLHNLTRAVSELVELDTAHDLDLTDGDVCEYVRRALAGQERAASEAGVKLHLRGPPHLMHRCDLVLLERAVGAVVRNALQHAPVGSANGLGLALAHTIATAHGGTLRLTANAPTGLRVELTIPEPSYLPAQLAPQAWGVLPPRR